MKYALVPIHDIEAVEAARKTLIEAFEILKINYPLVQPILDPIWKITNKKYNEIEIDDIKHFVGRN